MAYNDDQKIQIQQQTDIVRLIGEQVALRPKGKEFAGLCPFHDDKSPSMFVSPQKQIFKCFSCGAGGDAYRFVMDYHKMSFPEAMQFLADRAGIELKREGPRGRGAEGPSQKSQRDRIADANEKAVGFFRACLKHPEHGKIARDYITKRGISDEMVTVFQLGVAPDRWDGLMTMIASKGWDTGAFAESGLIKQRRGNESNPPSSNSNAGHYDALRHRLVFPIFDAIGRPIAFGGRKLREEDEPKYLNSPETPLFNKSATLYGLHAAKKPIIDSKTAVIVEGYTDVIACHQAGASNVVATLGTALTPQHARELRKYAEKVVLVFDADTAGQKAADRAVEVFLTGDVDVAIAVLPPGEDPDSLMKRPDGPEQWRGLVNAAEDALAYLFARMAEQLDSNSTITGRERLTQEYLTRLAGMGLHRAGTIRRSLVIQQLASLTHLSEQQVADQLKARAASSAPTPRPASPEPPPESAPDESHASPFNDMYESEAETVADGENRHKLKAVALAERQLIGGLMMDNALFHHALTDGRELDEAMMPGEFVTPGHRRLYERIHQRLSEGQSVTLASLLTDLAFNEEQDLARIATQCDADIERATLGKADRAAGVVVSAAEAIAGYHRDREYCENRARLARTNNTDEQPATDRATLLRQLVEHRKANPSPVRIARIGT